MREWLREYWILLVLATVTLTLLLGVGGWAIAESIKEAKQGWHYHATCEEVDYPVGDVSVPVWRCKGESNR